MSTPERLADGVVIAAVPLVGAGNPEAFLSIRSIDSAWTLTATEPSGGHLYLANGFLGTVLDWDGGVLFESSPSPCFIRGVYDRTGPGGIDRLSAVPSWNRLRYGRPARVRGYYRSLDIRHGILTTLLVLEEERGLVDIQQVMFISRADPHTGVLELHIRPHFTGQLTFLAGLETPREGQFHTAHVTATAGSIDLHGLVPDYAVEVDESLAMTGEGWSFAAAVGQVDAVLELKNHLSADSTTTVTQTARVAARAGDGQLTDLEGVPWSNPLQARHDHEAAWERLWATDIEIDGDPEAQLFVRSALYYLWSTVWECDWWSIPPMGLSGNGYNGHVFWDAEMWMFPALLVTQPELAYPCVAYRERTLPSAMARAQSGGFRGAQFPWEGGFTGAEMTPTWAQTGKYQLHITADVAIAQWWYYINTQDLDWLCRQGYPVIRACAEFWSSRVELNPTLDRFEVSNVVCADEYAEHVNNDAYTNAAVRQALLIAERAAVVVGEQPSVEWGQIAEKMHVPYDYSTGVHLEFDGYAGQMTKQADVELLAYPLEYVTDSAQIARNLDYYATVIDPNGPAMSFSIYSILASQLGRVDDAYEYFRRSYVPNVRTPFYAFSETPTNNAFFFCTGVGSALQAVLFGFTGLRLREDRAILCPVLPRQWKRLTLRNLYILGARTDIEIDSSSVYVSRLAADGTKQRREYPAGTVIELQPR